MFLKPLVERNRRFVERTIELHQEGRIPANSYVIDLDTVRANAVAIADEARRLGLRVYVMAKQLGRNPEVLRATAEAGLDAFVAVDMAGARAIHAAGHRVGHIGHLVQIPRAEASAASAMKPEHWTVFTTAKAREASDASLQQGRTQPLLARIHAPGDTFYMGHEGGFPADRVTRVAADLDALDGASFAGITTFPALLFDLEANDLRLTPNMATLEKGAVALADAGWPSIQVNAPGTTSTLALAMLASAGATQVEPGHGLTGTTPLHAVRDDLPERPAVLYLSEVSHLHAGRAYCFGGGLYIDPVFGPYDVRAVVGSGPEAVSMEAVSATLPPPEAIDYYGLLDVPEGRSVEPGDSVVFGFRIQAFVTRALVVPIAGGADGVGGPLGVWTSDGREVGWP
jgi:predicted amino acid racemase